ncbi:MAG: site-specific DNA-methyltransferase, partial [Thaumarchaeota archaeon]|nr:site-specific DNA-methyltransferase [Nitrososphaerota archaeon]
MSFRPDTIFCGDCEDVLGGFPDGRVDLIYADPPFYSNRTHEAVSGDGQERRSFEDRWEGGIQSYISWMEPRLRQCHRVLRSTGSMYLHCDWHASHYLKVLMDGIFGEENFQREIIWRVGWVSGFKSRAKNFIRNHETLLFYTKSREFTFNKLYVPHPEGYERRGGGANPKGVALDDVWLDIYSIQHLSFSRKKLGYPTQKPEELLDRVIEASTNRGDQVL